jgi:hypothetical protein
MKICFTEKEVAEIVLAYVQKFFPQANVAEISHYSVDYCRVTHEAPAEPEAE